MKLTDFKEVWSTKTPFWVCTIEGAFQVFVFVEPCCWCSLSLQCMASYAQLLDVHHAWKKCAFLCCSLLPRLRIQCTLTCCSFQYFVSVMQILVQIYYWESYSIVHFPLCYIQRTPYWREGHINIIDVSEIYICVRWATFYT